MTPRTHRRGFTMIELLVSLGVASILMTVVVSCIVAFQRSMVATESQRGSTESGRDAIFEIEHSLREAGFGLDPIYTFDMQWFRCGTTTTGIQGQTICRDSISAPDSLVFMARNPVYRIDPPLQNGCVTNSTTNVIGCPTGQAWTVMSSSYAGTPTITLKVTQGPQTFYAGEVLEVMCSGGFPWTFATVNRATTTSGPTVTLQLYPSSDTVPNLTPPALGTNPYFANNFYDASNNDCFNSDGKNSVSSAVAFAVERFGFFIQTYNNVPWLVLDTGLDLTNSGNDPWAGLTTANLIPIAPYVEDMQVAYIMDVAGAGAGAIAPDSNQNWVTGDDRTQTEPEAPYISVPGQMPLESPSRASGPFATSTQTVAAPGSLNPGNIRGIRVVLDLRSPQPDITMPATWFGDPLPGMENETERTLTNAQLGGFHRQTLMTTISPVNLTTTTMFTY